MASLYKPRHHCVSGKRMKLYFHILGHGERPCRKLDDTLTSHTDFHLGTTPP